MGLVSPLVNYLRAFLIEAIYRRLGEYVGIRFGLSYLPGSCAATMFPETANWLTTADE